MAVVTGALARRGHPLLLHCSPLHPGPQPPSAQAPLCSKARPRGLRAAAHVHVLSLPHAKQGLSSTSCPVSCFSSLLSRECRSWPSRWYTHLPVARGGGAQIRPPNPARAAAVLQLCCSLQRGARAGGAAVAGCLRWAAPCRRRSLTRCPVVADGPAERGAHPDLAVGGLLVDDIRAHAPQPHRQHALLQGEGGAHTRRAVGDKAGLSMHASGRVLRAAVAGRCLCHSVCVTRCSERAVRWRIAGPPTLYSTSPSTKSISSTKACGRAGHSSTQRQ